MTVFPLSVPAIKVSQPLGDFFVVSLDAITLQKVTFLDPTRIVSVDTQTFWYRLLGAQRSSSDKRARQIAKYIDTVEAAFPNSIILAANYINNGELQEDEEKRWKVEEFNHKIYKLLIPTSDPMASVVDGQHRLLGFTHASPQRRSMELLCAVYMDLPHAYQAYLFATININQRKVNKSLAYEQFGYNLDDEESESWAPDKLAVFFTRKLNLDPQSPFYQHIRIAPINAETLFTTNDPADWKVSTACVVEGIARLLSRNPKKDRDILHKKPANLRTRSVLAQDSMPLRKLYLENQDGQIYEIITSYFSAVKTELWDVADAKSYIKKTVGVQALFDVLRTITQESQDWKAETRAFFLAQMKKCAMVNFADPFFQASGTGRSRIRNCLELRLNLRQLNNIRSEHDEYKRLCRLE